MLKVNSVTNSSVLQIGSAGQLQAYADLHNTGEYEEFAEEAEPQDISDEPLVPLAPPTTA